MLSTFHLSSIGLVALMTIMLATQPVTRALAMGYALHAARLLSMRFHCATSLEGLSSMMHRQCF